MERAPERRSWIEEFTLQERELIRKLGWSEDTALRVQRYCEIVGVELINYLRLCQMAIEDAHQKLTELARTRRRTNRERDTVLFALAVFGDIEFVLRLSRIPRTGDRISISAMNVEWISTLDPEDAIGNFGVVAVDQNGTNLPYFGQLTVIFLARIAGGK